MKNGRYFKRIVEIFVFPIFVMIGLTFLMGFYHERNMYAKLKDITLELGEKLPEEITKYMNVLPSDSKLSLESNVILDENGHTSAIGTFNYYLVYKDSDYMFSTLTNVKSTISVVDTTNPIVNSKDNVEIEYDKDIDVNDVAECFDLSGCKMTFEEEVDTTKSGDYEITIKAVDGANNISYGTAKFKVLEKPKPVVYTGGSYYSAAVQTLNDKNNALNASLSDDEKNNLRYAIADFAKQFIGNPYVYGGTSLTNGTDCSGFTMSLYANYGYSLPRVPGDQSAVGIAVSAGELLPGDLIIYSYGHSAIYVGNGLMVHAATPQAGIVMQPMFDGYRSYRRVIY